MQYNTTVSHVSPLLSYVPGAIWAEGSIQSDPSVASYWSSGYHATNATDGEGRVLFHWFGTNIWVYGGYRQRLGPYKVIIDGVQVYKFGGYKAGDPEDFDAVLFNSTNLEVDEHQVEIVNISDDIHHATMDINRLIFESDSVSNTTILANSGLCRWGPEDSTQAVWMNDSNSQTTHSAVGNMMLNFTYIFVLRVFILSLAWNGIAIYGAVGPTSAPFSVSIDGWMSQIYTPNTLVNASIDDPPLLFAKNDLLQGNHTLVIRNNPGVSIPSGAATALNIHHAIVFAPQTEKQTHQVSLHELNIVIGTIIGAVLLSLVLAIAFFIIRSRRRHKRHILKLSRIRPFSLPPITRNDSASPPPSPHRWIRPLTLLGPYADYSHLAEGPTPPASPTVVPTPEQSPAAPVFPSGSKRRSRKRPLPSLPTLYLREEVELLLPPPAASPPSRVVAWPGDLAPPAYRLKDLH